MTLDVAGERETLPINAKDEYRRYSIQVVKPAKEGQELDVTITLEGPESDDPISLHVREMIVSAGQGVGKD